MMLKTFREMLKLGAFELLKNPGRNRVMLPARQDRTGWDRTGKGKPSTPHLRETEQGTGRNAMRLIDREPCCINGADTRPPPTTPEILVTITEQTRLGKLRTERKLLKSGSKEQVNKGSTNISKENRAAFKSQAH